jgi:hypothetical protein
MKSLLGGINMARQTRSPKQLGDFGEGLVTYTLIRKGYEVAYVDHVGADLIAEKNRRRYAISVKFRLFREGSNESRMVVISYEHINKLETFSRQFSMIPLFAQVVSIADERKIHLFITSVEYIKNILPKRKHGYSLRFGRNRIRELINNNKVDYSVWENKIIGNRDFV